MQFGKKLIVFILLLILLIKISSTAEARSVYVITDRSSTVRAYGVSGDQIEEQTTAQDLPDNGNSAVGLALARDSETLFVTYESSNIIEMVNAKTMIYEGDSVTVPDAPSIGLAGIVFDNERQKVYTVVVEIDVMFEDYP